MYIVSSIDKEEYCDSSDITYIVYLKEDRNPDIVLELTFKGIKEDKDIAVIIDEFNNPFRIKNSYNFSGISTATFKDKVTIFWDKFIKNGYECIVKSASKENLREFIEYLNNPEEIKMDVLMKEHYRLSGLIDNHLHALSELSKERRMLEYRIWTYSLNKE